LFISSIDGVHRNRFNHDIRNTDVTIGNNYKNLNFNSYKFKRSILSESDYVDANKNINENIVSKSVNFNCNEIYINKIKP
jgi:hypothetical protein